jgi:alcohol dehydrogenase class IV
MKNFNFHQTTKIFFGKGEICNLGKITRQYGKKVLLVTTHASIPALKEQYDRIKQTLADEGLTVTHFDKVIPNPTTDTIREGAGLARDNRCDVVIGLGGGSSMDAAKAISVEATHAGSCWDYLFYKTPQPDPNKLLPVIAVSTTSGTGSQVTQVAVVTNTRERDKSALYNNILYPKVCIIDPELMISVPKFVTATTGFDVLCHAFESSIHPNAGAYVNLLAWEAISLVVTNLPALVSDLSDTEKRQKMAWADTLGGLCIANAGVTLPHGMGMAIGGMYPHVAHGEALAIVYPAFAEFTWKSAIPQFARLARIMNPILQSVPDDEAAFNAVKEIPAFLESLGLLKSLEEINMPENEIGALAKQCMVLPDYSNNPRLATPGEMIDLVRSSYYKRIKSSF